MKNDDMHQGNCTIKKPSQPEAWVRRALVAGITGLGMGVHVIVGPLGAHAATASGSPHAGIQDATVVAVVDFNFLPYHWDFLGSKMPQATDDVATNDLPLGQSPDKWLPGFPDPKKAFASYERLDLTLEEKNAGKPIHALVASDRAKWNEVQSSTYDDVNYYWVPGTKVIGAIEFGNEHLVGAPRDHGVGVTSVSVGNIHGTCPECLLVFINLGNSSEAAALRWAMSQPWIDVVTNSYGHGVAKIYSGPGVEESRAASVRGQTIFFSGGNGVDDTFTVPNSTYHSSEKGPDWIVTVGGVTSGRDNYYGDSSRPEHGSYTGTGKPVDLAGIADDYPSAYDALTVGATGEDGFDGTSNAAPTVAGIYARALYHARRELKGPSRIQRGGTIAYGRRYRCGEARPDCELRDGVLNATELRNRLFRGAVHSSVGLTSYLGGQLPPLGEDEYMSEGHGTFAARESADEELWLEEFERIIGPPRGAGRGVGASTRRKGLDDRRFVLPSADMGHMEGRVLPRRRDRLARSVAELPGPVAARGDLPLLLTVSLPTL
ncbi:MAG: S8/S53 family peptidase [Actinomycetota bacterium]